MRKKLYVICVIIFLLFSIVSCSNNSKTTINTNIESNVNNNENNGGNEDANIDSKNDIQETTEEEYDYFSEKEVKKREEHAKRLVNMFRSLKLKNDWKNNFKNNDLFEEAEYKDQFEKDNLTAFLKYKPDKESYLAIYKKKIEDIEKDEKYHKENDEYYFEPLEDINYFDYAVKCFDVRHKTPEKYGAWGIVVKLKGDKNFLEGYDYAYNTETINFTEYNYFCQVATFQDNDEIVTIVFIDKGYRYDPGPVDVHYFVSSAAKIYNNTSFVKFEHENYLFSVLEDTKRGYPSFDILEAPYEYDIENLVVEQIRKDPNFVKDTDYSTGGTFGGMEIQQYIMEFKDEKDPSKTYSKITILYNSISNNRLLRISFNQRDDYDENIIGMIMPLSY